MFSKSNLVAILLICQKSKIKTSVWKKPKVFESWISKLNFSHKSAIQVTTWHFDNETRQSRAKRKKSRNQEPLFRDATIPSKRLSWEEANCLVFTLLYPFQVAKARKVGRWDLHVPPNLVQDRHYGRYQHRGLLFCQEPPDTRNSFSQEIRSARKNPLLNINVRSSV